MPNLTTHPEDIALNERQELVQFIGRPPSVFLRFGITAIGCFVVILLVLAYFIKYPDVVTAKVMITTENPPIRVLTKASGRVSHLLVKNNDVVAAGQLLAVIENTADYRDVLKLEKQLASLNPVNGGQFFSFFTGEGRNFGTLQNAYSTFTQNLKDYRYFLERNGVLQKITYLQKQIESHKALNINLLKQKEIQLKEFELMEKDMNRQKHLNTEGGRVRCRF